MIEKKVEELVKEIKEVEQKLENYKLFYEGYLHEIIRVCSSKIAIYNWEIKRIRTFDDSIMYDFSIQSNLGLEFDTDKKIEVLTTNLRDSIDFLVIPVEYLYYRDSSGEFIFTFNLPKDWAEDKMKQIKREAEYRNNKLR